MDEALLTTLAERLKALAHPARLRVLTQLARAKGCQCGQIVAGLPLAQSTVSQHIKILVEAGLVCGEADRPRACYCLDATALDALRRDLDHLFSLLRPPESGAGAPHDAASASCEPQDFHG
ncbi:MAG: metalloregulator ArsR/SmtB family transcription factor [Pseudomonadota bacterium]